MNLFYLIVIAGIFASSCSQLLLKESAIKTHKSLIAEFINRRIILAYIILLGSMFINIMGYKNGIQVKDMPILESLGYIFVPILSSIYFNEKIQARTILSITLITLGISIFYQ